MSFNSRLMDIYLGNLNAESKRLSTWVYLAKKHSVNKKTLSSISSIRKRSTDTEFQTVTECMYNDETVLFDNGTSSHNLEHIATLLRTGYKIAGKGKAPTTSHSRIDRSCTYLLESAGYYKIGVTLDTSIEKRIRALQTGNPNIITLVAKTGTIDNAYNIEKLLHEKFKSNRVRGEWFTLTKEELDFVHTTFNGAKND